MAKAAAADKDTKKPWNPADTKMPPEQVAMIERKAAERDLWQEIAPLLERAGLPPLPGKLTGRQFILVPIGDGMQESPKGVVAGTVTGYYVDNLGYLTLCLSAPYAPDAIMVRRGEKWELTCIGRKRGQRSTQECQFDIL